MAALKPRPDFAYAVDIDDGGAMDSHEIARIELFRQGLNGFSYVVDFARDVKARVVALRLNPVDIVDWNKQNAPAHGDGETLRIIEVKAGAIEQSKEPLGSFPILLPDTAFASACDRACQSIGGEGFEEVVHRVGVERAESIANRRRLQIW